MGLSLRPQQPEHITPLCFPHLNTSIGVTDQVEQYTKDNSEKENDSMQPLLYASYG